MESNRSNIDKTIKKGIKILVLRMEKEERVAGYIIGGVVRGCIVRDWRIGEGAR